MPKKHKKRSYRHLNQADRDRLQALCDEGVKQKEIAKILNVDPGTISREISRNRRKYRKRRNIKNKNARYEASVANHKAYLRRKYSKYQGKQINENEDLKMYIIAKLKQHWNPDEISGRMKRDGEFFYASKTAIYDWLRTSIGDRYWQKGGIENGIKMIRKFIPKGVDLAPYSDDDVKRVIEILNGKPRKSLNYATPQEIMVKQLFKNKKIRSEERRVGKECRARWS